MIFVRLLFIQLLLWSANADALGTFRRVKSQKLASERYSNLSSIKTAPDESSHSSALRTPQQFARILRSDSRQNADFACYYDADRNRVCYGFLFQAQFESEVDYNIIRDAQFYACQFQYVSGAAILVTSSNANLRCQNCIFQECIADFGCGGCVCCYQVQDAIFLTCTCNFASAYQGGFAHLEEVSSCYYFESCVIWAEAYYGGGLSILGSSTSINCYPTDFSLASVVSCIFTKCDAGEFASGILALNLQPTAFSIRNSEVSDSIAEEQSSDLGGGICVMNLGGQPSSTMVTFCVFRNNICQVHPYGTDILVAFDEGEPVYSNCPYSYCYSASDQSDTRSRACYNYWESSYENIFKAYEDNGMPSIGDTVYMSPDAMNIVGCGADYVDNLCPCKTIKYALLRSTQDNAAYIHMLPSQTHNLLSCLLLQNVSLSIRGSGNESSILSTEMYAPDTNQSVYAFFLVDDTVSRSIPPSPSVNLEQFTIYIKGTSSGAMNAPVLELQNKAHVGVYNMVVKSDASQPACTSSVVNLKGGKLTMNTVTFQDITLESQPLMASNVPARLAPTGLQFWGITRKSGNGAVYELSVSSASTLNLATSYDGCKTLAGNGGALSLTVQGSATLTIGSRAPRIGFVNCQAGTSNGAGGWTKAQLGGAIMITLASANARVVVGENLEFDTSHPNSASHGYNIYLYAPDLKTVVTNESWPLLVAIPTSDYSTLMPFYEGCNSATSSTHVPLLSLFKGEPEIIYVNSNGTDTEECGAEEASPCLTMSTATGRQTKDKKIHILTAAALNETYSWSTYSYTITVKTSLVSQFTVTSDCKFVTSSDVSFRGAVFDMTGFEASYPLFTASGGKVTLTTCNINLPATLSNTLWMLSQTGSLLLSGVSFISHPVSGGTPSTTVSNNLIRSTGTGSMTLTNTRISNLACTEGLIKLMTSTPSLTINSNTHFSSITLTSTAPLIDAPSFSSVSVSSSSFTDITRSSGDGSVLSVSVTTQTVTITGTTFTRCKTATDTTTPTGNGGAVCLTVSGGTATFGSKAAKTTFESCGVANGKGDGGAVYVSMSSGTLSLINVDITTCTSAGGSGGAVFGDVSGGKLVLDTVSMAGCRAANGKGGAVYVTVSGGTVDADGVEIKDQTSAGGEGGAIYIKMDSGTVDLNRVNVQSCTSTNGKGGALYAEVGDGTLNWLSSQVKQYSASGDGGAVYVKMTTGTIVLNGVAISEQTSAGGNGGAVYVTMSGGTVDMEKVSMDGCLTTNGKGGALYAEVKGGGLTWAGTEVTGCSASGDGGGVYVILSEGSDRVSPNLKLALT